ncbi:MAG TPA: hypothetical protein VHJ69_08695 [Gemmatimonadales bacterium]|nr:hypothetical protein [Gemmatimonadales bacterium]
MTEERGAAGLCWSTAAALALATVQAAAAQTSPFLSLDDTRYPLLEHLIARGDIDDPSPMIRPFRRSDALRVLVAADTAPGRGTGAIIHELREQFTDDTVWHWRAEARAGGTLYTQKRRDLLHLGGQRDWNYYADLGLQAVVGPVVAVTRPAIEPRLIGDPDWPNNAQDVAEDNVTARLIEGYISAQAKIGNLTYGQLDWNWGPVGIPGIPLSNYGYQRQGASLDFKVKPIRLTALYTPLQREQDSLGQFVNRQYFVHRLEGEFSRRFRLALWEGILIRGVGQGFDFAYANPVAPSVVTNAFGIGTTPQNTIIGVDIDWVLSRRSRFQAQLALDDFWFNDRHMKQDRWAFTLSGFGALGSRLGWRALYTQVSSLALRTFYPEENFTDADVGIGRNFSDQDRASLYVTIPVRTRWLVTPELTFQRQGEGRINDPYPPLGPDSTQVTPMLFIGVVEKTYRVSIGVAGRQGPLDLTADAGFHHVTNDQNVPGVTANRFVGRIMATLGWRKRGRFQGERVKPDSAGSTTARSGVPY